MKHLKHAVIIGCFLLIATLFVACGSDASGTGSAGGSTPTPTATSAPTDTPTATATPSPAATTATSSFINTAQVTIGGKAVTVLTNSKGFTLYYLTSDSATSVTCTGGCASTWPPVLFTGSGKPDSSNAAVAAQLTVFNGADGNQVEYNGHPLYTFAGDTAAGQTNGQGVAGVWYAMQQSGTAYSNGGY